MRRMRRMRMRKQRVGEYKSPCDTTRGEACVRHRQGGIPQVVR